MLASERAVSNSNLQMQSDISSWNLENILCETATVHEVNEITEQIRMHPRKIKTEQNA
jgi:hypothetical protein